MKKILPLLLFLTISFNSIGETINCSGNTLIERERFGSIELSYKRDGNKFIYISPMGTEPFKLDIAYEDENNIILQKNRATDDYFIITAISIYKQGGDFTRSSLRTSVWGLSELYTSKGTCEFIE